MKDRMITEIEQAMVASLDNAQMKLLHDVLTHAFWNKEITESEGIPAEQTLESNNNLMQGFLSSKRVEGCSEKTLKYYKGTIGRLLSTLDKHLVHVTTDDLRQYLAENCAGAGCQRKRQPVE